MKHSYTVGTFAVVLLVIGVLWCVSFLLERAADRVRERKEGGTPAATGRAAVTSRGMGRRSGINLRRAAPVVVSAAAATNSVCRTADNGVE